MKVSQEKTKPNQRGIRVLHVIHELKPGGIENWLLNLLREIDHEKIQMDFLVHTTQPQAYDKEILNLGSQIIPCPWPKQPLRYAKELKRILQEYGPYDIIHSHIHHYSGWVLRTAQKCGIPIRVAHSHSNLSTIQRASPIPRKMYYAYTEHLVKKHATLGLAASEKAAESLFGSKWKQDPRWRVLHCGIDLQPFYQSYNREAIRSQLNIPPDALVVGHVGRFATQKNHEFLINIVSEVAKKHTIQCMLIGEGVLQETIRNRVAREGLTKNILFLGLRDDVPRLMMAAMDIFVFPSRWEGLGLVLAEAQAAGLPCIISDAVPIEADVIPELISRLPLSVSAHDWAEKVILTYEKQKIDPFPQTKALKILEISPFNIKQSCSSIESLYQTEVDRVRNLRANP